MSISTNHSKRVNWLLSGQLGNQPVRQFGVDVSRYTVGRKPESSLSVSSPSVSREHAELTIVDDGLLLRDLGSTNGTYVNGKRIHQPCTVHHGDLLQFGQLVFRVIQQPTAGDAPSIHDDSSDRAFALIQFDQLMTQRAVTTHFQPIVAISDCRVLGYEVLGRSPISGLEEPCSMFAAAKLLNLEGELSRILREEGIRSGQVLPDTCTLFVNTHPVELQDIELLIFSLNELREFEPRRPIVLEIREAAVPSSDQMSELRAALTKVQIGLAYDDFGALKERFVELIEVPPDYLKFDMRVVQNLESASREQRRLIAKLVQIAIELGITPLAQGIETPGDEAICRQIGFTCAQGFYYGYPALPKAIIQADSADVGDPTNRRDTR